MALLSPFRKGHGECVELCLDDRIVFYAVFMLQHAIPATFTLLRPVPTTLQ